MTATKRQLDEVDNKGRREISRKRRSAKPSPLVSRESQAEPDLATPSIDPIDVASMDSFPCSDPPGYYPISS